MRRAFLALLFLPLATATVDLPSTSAQDQAFVDSSNGSSFDDDDSGTFEVRFHNDFDDTATVDPRSIPSLPRGIELQCTSGSSCNGLTVPSGSTRTLDYRWTVTIEADDGDENIALRYDWNNATTTGSSTFTFQLDVENKEPGRVSLGNVAGRTLTNVPCDGSGWPVVGEVPIQINNYGDTRTSGFNFHWSGGIEGVDSRPSSLDSGEVDEIVLTVSMTGQNNVRGDLELEYDSSDESNIDVSRAVSVSAQIPSLLEIDGTLGAAPTIFSDLGALEYFTTHELTTTLTEPCGFSDLSVSQLSVLPSYAVLPGGDNFVVPQGGSSPVTVRILLNPADVAPCSEIAIPLRFAATDGFETPTSLRWQITGSVGVLGSSAARDGLDNASSRMGAYPNWHEKTRSVLDAYDGVAGDDGCTGAVRDVIQLAAALGPMSATIDQVLDGAAATEPTRQAQAYLLAAVARQAAAEPCNEIDDTALRDPCIQWNGEAATIIDAALANADTVATGTTTAARLQAANAAHVLATARGDEGAAAQARQEAEAQYDALLAAFQRARDLELAQAAKQDIHSGSTFVGDRVHIVWFPALIGVYQSYYEESLQRFDEAIALYDDVGEDRTAQELASQRADLVRANDAGLPWTLTIAVGWGLVVLGALVQSMVALARWRRDHRSSDLGQLLMTDL